MKVHPFRMPSSGLSLLIIFLLSSGSETMYGQDLSAPRFFKLNFQSLGATASPVLPAYAKLQESGDPDEAPNFLLESSLRFPVKLRGKTRIFGEIGYRNEFVYGFYSREEQELETMELFRTDFSLILQHQFGQGFSLSNAFSVNSQSSTAFDLGRQALQFSNLSMLEKPLPKGEIGLGSVISFRQQLSIVPIFKYKTELPNDWSIDLLLPAKALVIKDLPGNARLMAGFRGSHANYFVHSGDLDMDVPGDARYRRLNVNGIVAYEKLLTPWLGVMTELGVNVPLRSGLYDPYDPRREIHSFQNRVSPHFRVGLFLCVPESLLGISRN
jgi:hypothetical protein